jgi:hypothetical protein
MKSTGAYRLVREYREFDSKIEPEDEALDRKIQSAATVFV